MSFSGGATALVKSWNDTRIVATVPLAAQDGPILVSVPVAVDLGGMIYAYEGPLQDGTVGEKHVIAISGANGRPAWKVDLPKSFRYLAYDAGYTLANDYETPRTSPLSLFPDGSLYLEAYVEDDRAVIGPHGECVGGSWSTDRRLYLVKISSDGNADKQLLSSYKYNGDPCGGEPILWWPGEVIPDGSGGFLALAAKTDAMGTAAVNVFHNAANPFTLPMESVGSVILGEGNIAFANDLLVTREKRWGSRVVAFNINGGAVWTYNAPSGYVVRVLAATSGGGLVAIERQYPGVSERIIRFDASGNATYDGASSTTSFATRAYSSTSGMSTLSFPSLSGLIHLGSDVFLGNVIYGSAKVSAVSSGREIEWSGTPDWVSVPDDRASTKHQVSISAYKVDGTTGQDIEGQIRTAIKFWEKKIKGLHFNWNGVTSVPVCDREQCTTQQRITTFYLSDRCQTTVSWDEYSRRFHTDKGLNMVFTDTIEIDRSDEEPYYPTEIVPWKTIPPCRGAGNLEIYSNTSAGNVAAHAIGHSFNLVHLPGQKNGENLMCDPNQKPPVCPDLPGEKLTVDQIKDATIGMTVWEQ